MRRRTRLAAAAAAAALAAPAVHAQTMLNIRVVLDWAFQGPQAPFLWALERGHFRREGLNVQMDRGTGSGDVPIRLASGACDVGIADLNPTIRLRLERPEVNVFTPFIIHDATDLAVMTLRRENIRTPAGLHDRTIAAPDSDAGRQLFPAFAHAAGIDAARVRWLSVSPALREPMLAQQRANAITGFVTSGIFSRRGLGFADEDIVTMRYGDFGADFHSTSLLMGRRFADENPRAVTGLIRAIVRAQYEVLADPAAGAALLRNREPLTDVPLETARLQRGIDMVRAAFHIERPMPWGEIYDPRFLPPETGLRLA